LTIEIIRYEAKQAEEWDAFVRQSETACLFHEHRYRRVVEQSFGHRAIYLGAVRDGELTAILPLFAVNSLLFGRFLVSLPFVDYGGICSNNSESTALLLDAAADLMREIKAESVELRHQYTALPDLYTRTNKVNVVLPLPEDPETAWHNFRSEIRNRVHKARKAGLTFDAGALELLGDFYQVFSRCWRDKGTPVYPRSFFQVFLETFTDCSEVFVIRSEGKPIAGAIATYFRDVMEIPWPCSLRAYWDNCPNNLLYWEAIRRGCERGYKSFHFGRSSKGSGTHTFKSRWGGEDQQLYYQFILPEGRELPNLDPNSSKYRTLVSAWSRLPLWLANWLGPFIVRGIP
jgi:serine/alanine adding enzyme